MSTPVSRLPRSANEPESPPGTKTEPTPLSDSEAADYRTDAAAVLALEPVVPTKLGSAGEAAEAARAAFRTEVRAAIRAEAKAVAKHKAAKRALLEAPAEKAAPEANTTPGSPAPAISGADAARALRKARARRLIAALFAWVGIPVLLASVYYGLIAQPQFVSIATLAVRGTEATAHAAMLREYIASPEMLAVLDKRDHFTDHFEDARDPLVRLPRKAGSEARAASYRDQVKTDYDAQTGVLVLKVRALSGSAAERFAKTIVSECRGLFVRIEDDVQARRLAEAEDDLAQARERLLTAERALAAGGPSPAGEGALAGDARVRQVTRDLAEREVDAALSSLSKVRNSVRARQAPLVTISKPSLPTEPSYPRRLYGVMTVLFVSLGLFGVGSLLISAVREHAQF